MIAPYVAVSEAIGKQTGINQLGDGYLRPGSEEAEASNVSKWRFT